MSQPPNVWHEDELRSQGYELVAGIDEVGRGALAGPVVASAVILPLPADLNWFETVRDSKELTHKKREALFDLIKQEAVAIGIGIIPPQVIDSLNILTATRMAMMQAVEQLCRPPSFLLIDRLGLPQCPIPQRGITRGDKSCLSIACASIVAKVTRDRMMEEIDRTYSGYGFALHKGYGTSLHLYSLRKLGPSPVHRRHFAPVRNVIIDRKHQPSAAVDFSPVTRIHSRGSKRRHNPSQGTFHC